MQFTFEVDKLIVQALLSSELGLIRTSAVRCLDDASIRSSNSDVGSPSIFAIAGKTAISRHLELEDEAPFKVYVKEEFLGQASSSGKKNSSRRFIEVLDCTLKSIIKKSNSNQQIIGRRIEASEVINNEFQVSVYQSETLLKLKKVVLVTWPKEKTIHQVLDLEIISIDKVVLNPTTDQLLISENNSFKPLNDQEPLNLDVHYSLSNLESEIQRAVSCLQALEFVNRISASSNKLKITKSEQFVEVCKSSLDWCFGNASSWTELRKALDLVASSDCWKKCFSDLINWGGLRIVLSKTPNSNNAFFKPIPFKPQAIKRLLEMNRKLLDYPEETFRFFADSEFRDISGLRLLSLAAAMVGDLLEFVESKACFATLLSCFLGPEQAKVIMDDLVEGSLNSRTNMLIAQVAGANPQNLFLFTNSGNQFCEEDPVVSGGDELDLNIRPDEDSCLLNHRQQMEESFVSETMQFSIGGDPKGNYSKMVLDSLSSSHVCSPSSQKRL